MIELPDSLDACHILLEQTNDTNESLAKDDVRERLEYIPAQMIVHAQLMAHKGTIPSVLAASARRE